MANIKETGQILAAKNPDLHVAPASLTKLMTIYLVSSALQSGKVKAEDLVEVSKAAWKTGGSRMFIQVGTQVPVDSLLQGIIVDSDIVVAE